MEVISGNTWKMSQMINSQLYLVLWVVYDHLEKENISVIGDKEGMSPLKYLYSTHTPCHGVQRDEFTLN